MKPIYIKMSAFGSYAGVETVDFKDVNHGIFLITGDTGAGKTTIFDAITYALYDDTSGGKRDGEMMRSQYADEDTRTYVELKFIYNGEIYTITRAPKQNRISKRRNKDGEYTLTVDAPTVELILPDGLPFKGKIKETNQKVVDIVGLDRNQFTQIAMIAQGDFLKLLHAPSKERKEIFAKIFDTKIYWRIEEELKARTKAMHVQLEDNKKDIIREMDNVQLLHDSNYKDQWAGMPRFLESDSDKLLDMVKLIIQETKEKEDEINDKLTQNQSELDLVNTSIHHAEATNKLFATLELLLQSKRELENKKEGMERIKVNIDLAKRAALIGGKEIIYLSKQKEYEDCQYRIDKIKIWLQKNEEILSKLKLLKEESEIEYRSKTPELSAKVIRIRELLPKYEQYEVKYKTKEILKHQWQVAKQHLEQVLVMNEKIKGYQDKRNKEQEELKPMFEQLVEITHNVERLSEQRKSLLALQDLVKSVSIRYEKYKESEITYQKSVQTQEENTAGYEAVYHQFIDGQAAFLASSLEEGQPCPVCGSTSHPLIADDNHLKISQQELEEAKKRMDHGANLVSERYEKYQNAKHRYESERQLTEHEGKKLFDSSFQLQEFTLEELKSAQTHCEEELKRESALKEKSILARNKFEVNEKELLKLSSELEANEKNSASIEKTLKEQEIQLAEDEAILNALGEALIFSSIESAQSEIAATDQQLYQLDDRYHTSTKEYELRFNETSEKKGKLKSEQETLFRLSQEWTTSKEAFLSELLKQGFRDITEYHSAKLDPDQIETLSENFQKYRENLIKIEENLKSYQEQTVGKVKINTQEMINSRSSMLLTKKTLEEESKLVYGIRTRNESISQSVTKLIQKRNILKEGYTNISRLDATANGRLSQCHMNFQTYIQRKYFNYVIGEANKRLYIMSSNQFVLRCRDVRELAGQGEVGLDLDIYSMVNDQTRDVKTLSGGESFIAALAMALGMADIIQNTAGSIHIDTMFIDEGFGSLSDDTRMQAINILNELSEGKRLVGIISHVTELKAQIDTKLVVKKGEKGSSVRWEKG